MENSNAAEPAGEGLSPAIELMGRITKEAVNEAMEDRFLPFLEDCLSDAETPRNGRCERKVLTTVGEKTVRVPRDRLGLRHKPVPIREVRRGGIRKARPRHREGKLRRGREAQPIQALQGDGGLR